MRSFSRLLCRPSIMRKLSIDLRKCDVPLSVRLKTAPPETLQYNGAVGWSVTAIIYWLCHIIRRLQVIFKHWYGIQWDVVQTAVKLSVCCLAAVKLSGPPVNVVIYIIHWHIVTFNIRRQNFRTEKLLCKIMQHLPLTTIFCNRHHHHHNCSLLTVDKHNLQQGWKN